MPEPKVILTDEEFARVTADSKDPLVSAIQVTVGAASVCWSEKSLEGAGEFDSMRAGIVADDLARYLRRRFGLVPVDDLAWLEVLLENAVPRTARGSTDWEGKGRAYAQEILNRAMGRPVGWAPVEEGVEPSTAAS